MTGLQPESPKVVIPASLKQTDPLMAEAIEKAGKARITYGQNQAFWHQNVLDAFSLYLPELANRKLSPDAFCRQLTEAAQRNED